MTLAAGTSLAHYTILGPLGAGAMGEVYRARDTRLRREVAIKVLPEEFATDEERLKRFEREARSLATLNHPNVAQIHGVDQVGDACFLVLELVEGETLSRPTSIRASGAVNYGGHFIVSCARSGSVLAPVEGERRTRLVELDARGELLRELALEPDYYASAAYSRAGDRALLLREEGRGSELRMADLGRGGVWSRLVDDRFVRQPVWSRDDAWVYYSSDRVTRDIFRCRTAGAGAPELVMESGNLFAYVNDLAPDGKSLLINKLDASHGRDLWLVDLESKTSRPLLDGPGNQFDTRFSPDGKWIAYASDESGRIELYVQDHPDVQTRVRVSTAGLGCSETGTPSAALIHWSPDGNELVYLAPDRRGVIAVAVTREPTFQVGAARKLFDLPPDTLNADVSADGQRVLALVPDPSQPPCALAVTLDWLAELEPAQ